MSLRRLLFWSHLTVGLVVGLIIAFLAVTGCLLAFQQQITDWAERGTRVHERKVEACLLPSQILKAAGDVRHDNPISWTSFSNPTKPTEISFSKGVVYLVDPCEGRVLDSQAGHLRTFFLSVKDLHRYAAWEGVKHENLRTIKDACVLGFVFLMLTGMVLWFPRKWTSKHVRVAMMPRWTGPGRASEWSLHTVFGFWLCLPLFVIAATGLIMGYLWANNLLYRISGDPVPAVRAERNVDTNPLPVSRYEMLDQLISRASKQDPAWRSLLLRIPSAKGKDVTITLDSGDGRDPRTKSQLILNRKTAEVIRWDRFQDNVRGRRWRLYARFIHSGELFGLPGQIVAFISSLGALLLVLTGITLSLRRYSAWRVRRKRFSQQKTTDSSPVPVS
jgi:uncharacterized iron-regulated membrane protein